MNTENSKDLLEFINYECLETLQTPPKTVFNYFSKCCIKTINELSNKFVNKEKDNCIINGSKMFFYVFFYLINYTNNLKLTIFLSERAILLYSEFIIMSNDKNITSDLNYNPNINDAISFAYKKTIGPINLNTLDKTNKNKLDYVRDVSNIVVNIYNKLYLSNSDLLKEVEIIDTKIVIPLLNIFSKFNSENYNYIHKKFINYLNTDIDIEELLVKFKVIIDNLIKIDYDINLKFINKLFNIVFDDVIYKTINLKLKDILEIKKLPINLETRKSVKIFKKIYMEKK